MRSTARLPSLAGLRLGTADGAPTGMEASASRRRRVDNPPAPPPQPLVGLPGDMLELIVKQAVASARTSPTPVHDLCEWMKSFCRSAKMQGVGVGCEDDWYLAAMGVFGYTPDPAAAKAPALPSYSVFKSWRELFDVLCGVFDVSEARFQNNTALTAAQLVWQKVENEMRNEWVPFPYGTLGKFIPPMDGSLSGSFLIKKWRAIAEVYRDSRDTSQRHLDTLLDIVLEGMITLRFEALMFDERTRLLKDPEPKREEITREFRSDWEKWTRNEPNALSDPKMSRKHRGFMAVVQLLLLRGAKPFTWRAYLEKDMASSLVMDEAFSDGRDHAYGIELLNFVLDEGATLETYKVPLRNPDADEAVFKDPEYEGFAPVNIMAQAIRMGDGEIIKLLLDRGWKLSVYRNDGGIHELMRDRGWQQEQRIPPPPVIEYELTEVQAASDTIAYALDRTAEDWMSDDWDWTADEATTKRLIKAMQPWVDLIRRYNISVSVARKDPRRMAQEILDAEERNGAESPYKADWFALLLRPDDSLEEYRAERNAAVLALNAAQGSNYPLPYP